jgi:hypothetical protein
MGRAMRMRGLLVTTGLVLDVMDDMTGQPMLLGWRAAIGSDQGDGEISKTWRR